MKGLLIKDFYLTKKHSMVLVGIALLFFTMSFLAKSMYFAFYPIALISILAINTLAYDDYYRWNKSEVTLPVSRTLAVLEKYLLLLIFILPTIIISNLVFLLVFKYSLSDIIRLMSLMLFAGAIVPSLIFPISFKIGYTRAKTINILLTAFIVSIISFLNIGNISGDNVINGTFAPQKSTPLFAVAAVILLGISMLLSIKFYKKREF